MSPFEIDLASLVMASDAPGAIMIAVGVMFWLSISFILGGFYNALLCVTWPWTSFLSLCIS